MAKGLNKHTPNSEELLKRLNSNDSSGLDDFEKEALEGFDSLDNAELAKNLTDSLNKKIDGKYFKKEGGNKKGMMYLSMAAGLVLVVGLSIFFINIMGGKKEVAMENATAPEKIANEVANPTDLSPPPPPAAEAEEFKKEGKVSGGDADAKPLQDVVTEAATGSGAKDIPDNTKRAETQPNDDGLHTRMVLKEKKAENKTADLESNDESKKQEADKLAQGPGNVTTPSVIADTKGKAKEEEEKLDANEKTVSKNNNVNNSPAPETSTALASGKKEPAKKPADKDRRKDSNGESLGKEDAPTEEIAKAKTTTNQQAVGGVAGNTNRDEDGYVHNVEYSNTTYSKPQDYLKVEINKSEMLKTNVKAFKAELTISDKGIVTAVKFLTPIDNNCTGCKKELEKILLNMPGWKSSASKKAVKETVSYIDQ